ncbi:4Fe-4S binding protein [Magnetospirillum sulfuroxidans]|uniref:4Fe-4S binding protein n=1 Tax=Magnetospirillum sulfuroxidans TaxID=611300 RepID=A0ABS5I929_9PROT|nr:4Fe-4S binding protein [Magnetospirillum sulfuroxidans]MBR9970946.1 4Fe-4S binding protein [Magnetospirillum sulfuroxidans]
MNALTLMRLRPWVQAFSLIVLVYGAGAVGHYSADKLSGALPALSCAYDQENAAYCVLVPLQHQLHHRVGEGLVKLHGITMTLFLPLMFTVLSFLAFFVVLNKAFCGWICPLGTVQEALHRIGQRFDLAFRRVPPAWRPRVSSIKWIVLVLAIFALPLISGMGVLPHSFRDPWCQVCPSRIVTTLATGDVNQLALPLAGTWSEIIFVVLRDLGFGFGAVFALSFRQPFCRVCPMLALHAMLRRFAPLRLVKRASARCDRCGLCAKACPMDITAIHTASGATAFDADCTLCGRCIAFCPEDGTLSLRLGPLPLVKSSAAAFNAMTRRESPEGKPKPVAKAGR